MRCKMVRKKLAFATVVMVSAFGLWALLTEITVPLFILDYCTICPKRNTYYVVDFEDVNKTFTLLPKVNCKKTPPYLVLLITCTRDEKEARMAIRETWGRRRRIEGKLVFSYFLLGISPYQDINAEAELINESNTYNDIVQRPFIDTYYNLTLKTIMGIDWVSDHCPETRFVMKTDSDMFVNTFYLVQLLAKKNQSSNFFTGFLKLNEYPIRNIFSKWYASKREYPGAKYPPFCSGTGYVFSVDVAKKIHNISTTVPFFKLEDVYLGLCLDILDIHLEELHTEQTFFAERQSFSVCKYSKLVTSHGVKPYENIVYWNLLQRPTSEKC
ncbi:hypothetical protein XENTR_v10004821 [Xenopus tropicalis]|uniref:Hexosyltransferase n=1 Tax=Xenopus tropicalis TaxID=8364 RepID=F7CGG9_XENTR|eukprot:XP_017946880.1 PREDICTED: beta-1,3-galactosyltransferase 5-like [Xenopus tropicalis]